MSDIIERLKNALADRYTVERQLGEGGMATVYLAHDLKHDRKVAIKVLRPELAAVLGAERFLNEIKVTANLQHPHILPLFDSGQADGFLYYVMPYVEGESLRDRLDREKQLGVDEAVEITRAVASALDYAHRHDVIHRDIKPENIMLHDGQPLVMDFGIALALSAAGGQRITETGLSLGTPYYMSPEQASGDRHVDGRSDVYSLGCVLYELLAGEPPFTGGTVQAIVSKIVTEEPRRVTDSRPAVPANVVAAIHHAMAKVPADRFATAARFADALADPAYIDRAAPSRVVEAKHSLTLAVIATLAVAVVVLLGMVIFGGEATRAAGVQRLAINLPDGVTLELLGPGSGVAISPDGNTVVFVGRQQDTTRLYVRNLDQFDTQPLPGTEGAWGPFFSPDGRTVGFLADHKLKTVSLLGGNPLTVADAGDAGGGSWTANDVIIFDNWPEQGIWRAPAAGGDPEPLLGDEGTLGIFIRVLWPWLLPHNAGVLYTRLDARRVSVAARRMTGESEAILVERGMAARYVSTGHLVYAWGGELLAANFDLDELEVIGSPVSVVQGLLMERLRPRLRSTSSGYLTGQTAHFDVSPKGTLVYVPGTSDAGQRSLVWVDRSGRTEPLGLPVGDYAGPRVSPDGQRILFGNSRDGRFDLWVHDRSRGFTQPVTGAEGSDYWPIWTRDGEGIVWNSARPGSAGLFLKQLSDPAAERPLARPSTTQTQPGAFSPDDRLLVFQRGEADRDLWVVDVSRDTEPEILVQNPGGQFHAVLSPDGNWLAYASDESGRTQVMIRPFPGPGSATQVSTDGGHEPLWSHDGRELFFRDYTGTRMYTVAIQTSPRLRIGRPQLLFTGPFMEGRVYGRNFDVTPDGRRFLMVMDAQPEAVTQIRVVMNWFEELEQLVP
jgi:serine/threonine-protein kinase